MKMSVTIFSSEKTLFKAIKTRSSKDRKIDIFPKGLTHGFGRKMAMLSSFFFSQYRPQKCRFDILERRDAFLGYKNKKFKKWKNWYFSKGVNQWFLSKNGHFCDIFFLGNIGLKNVFSHILEWKNAFLGYKYRKFKKWKNWHFSKGVNWWFRSQKWQCFSLFFFRQYRPEKCLLRYSRAIKRLSRL